MPRLQKARPKNGPLHAGGECDDPMRIAVCPGSFDPITNGHVDVIERALKLFDKIIVLVGENPSKETAFSAEERVEMIKEVFKGNNTIEVEHFDGLLLDYMKKRKINVMVRGLRALSDFEYEFQRALMNRELSPNVETVFVMTKDDYAFVSSSILKEIAMLGGDVSRFVPNAVAKKMHTSTRKRISSKLI